MQPAKARKEHKTIVRRQLGANGRERNLNASSICLEGEQRRHDARGGVSAWSARPAPVGKVLEPRAKELIAQHLNVRLRECLFRESLRLQILGERRVNEHERVELLHGRDDGERAHALKKTEWMKTLDCGGDACEFVREARDDVR